jgi:hypothetical protein
MLSTLRAIFVGTLGVEPFGQRCCCNRPGNNVNPRPDHSLQARESASLQT